MISFDFDKFRLLILSTDLLLFVLVVSFPIFLLFAQRRAHYRAAWKQIRSKPLPMICMGICMFYAATALLDSVHFQKRMVTDDGKKQFTAQNVPVYQARIQTVLDSLCTGLG